MNISILNLKSTCLNKTTGKSCRSNKNILTMYKAFHCFDLTAMNLWVCSLNRNLMCLIFEKKNFFTKFLNWNSQFTQVKICQLISWFKLWHFSSSKYYWKFIFDGFKSPFISIQDFQDVYFRQIGFEFEIYILNFIMKVFLS